MAEFRLKKSFNIDNGELDGLRLKDAFVLGYELRWIDELIERGCEIHRPVHALNKERIEQAFKDAGREFRLVWMPGDSSEEWMQLDA